MIFDLITGFFLNKFLIFSIDIIAIFLAILVYRDNSRGVINRIYILMTISMMIWVNFAYFPRVMGQYNYDLGLAFLKIAWFATPPFFSFLYIFTVYLINKEKEYRILNKIVILAGVILATISGFTDWTISGFVFIGSIVRIIYGPFMYLFLGIISCIIMVTLIPIYKSKALTKNKDVVFFLAGLLIFYIFNVIFNIVLPIFFNISRFYFLGDYSTIILLVLTAYAIIKHQLFNVKVIATELLVFAIWIAVLIEFLMEDSLKDKLFTGAIFVFVIVAGIFLIRSVKKEVGQREELEKLTHELQHANEELKQLDKAKSEFISIVSHQLRTPLSITKGYVSMILEGIYGKITDKLKETLEKVYVANEGLIDLVNNLLDLSRMEAGTIKYEFKDADLVSMVDEIVTELDLEAKHRNLYLKWTKPAEQLPMIKADTIKLKQVVEILIENSLKYTPKGGVEVFVEKKLDSLLFKVKDTGIGIDPHELDHLFQKFGRGAEGSKVNVTGVGLGLYAAKQIVLKHNGEIWAESEGIGKGSTFVARLPFIIEQDKPLAEPASGEGNHK